MGVLGEDGVVGLEGVAGEVGGALGGADGDVELGGGGQLRRGGGGRTRGLPMQTMRGAGADMVRCGVGNSNALLFLPPLFRPFGGVSRGHVTGGVGHLG